MPFLIVVPNLRRQGVYLNQIELAPVKDADGVRLLNLTLAVLALPKEEHGVSGRVNVVSKWCFQHDSI